MMVRMNDAQDASEAARSLAAKRWDPSPVVVRAAHTVCERVDELPPTLRAAVHLATADQEDPDEC